MEIVIPIDFHVFQFVFLYVQSPDAANIMETWSITITLAIEAMVIWKTTKLLLPYISVSDYLFIDMGVWWLMYKLFVALSK